MPDVLLLPEFSPEDGASDGADVGRLTLDAGALITTGCVRTMSVGKSFHSVADRRFWKDWPCCWGKVGRAGFDSVSGCCVVCCDVDDAVMLAFLSGSSPIGRRTIHADAGLNR